MSTSEDFRGYVRIWGGFVQVYRGYMKRNAAGPYDPCISCDIGVDKDYWWDDNLRCTTPPLYPERLECDDDGIESDQYNYKIAQFRDF